MERQRDCPNCKNGIARVKTGYQKGTLQRQYMSCKSCGHEWKRWISAADVFRRPTPRKRSSKLQRDTIGGFPIAGDRPARTNDD
jgi:hypothetical protein